MAALHACKHAQVGEHGEKKQACRDPVPVDSLTHSTRKTLPFTRTSSVLQARNKNARKHENRGGGEGGEKTNTGAAHTKRIPTYCSNTRSRSKGCSYPARSLHVGVHAAPRARAKKKSSPMFLFYGHIYIYKTTKKYKWLYLAKN